MIAFAHGFLRKSLCIYSKAIERLAKLKQSLKLEKGPIYSWPDRIYKVDPDEFRAWLEELKKERICQTK